MQENERVDRERRLESLFSDHFSAVSAYARRRFPRRLAEDIVAETFVVAWRRIALVPTNPRPWLLAVARNVAATQLRSEQRRSALLKRLEENAAKSDFAVTSSTESSESVIAALERMPQKDQEAIKLIAWDELTPGEAAKVMGQSGVSFRVRLHRARSRLKQEIARVDEEAVRNDALPELRPESRPL